MVALDKAPGRYRIALNMYFDEINQNVGGAPDADALIYVYRKSDNKRITSFYVSYTTRQPVVYANQSCATLRQIKTTLYRYERIVTWNPPDYADPAGYYMTWQYCCRNGDIDNIQAPSQAGQTFYLEFPALMRSGQSFLDSSPVFGQVDGEYICVGEPFRFSFDAHDAEGDELRYSMATPFDRLDPNLGIGSNNGLTVQWLPGFGPDNAITGNAPLTVNKQTGELTVTATVQGLYVFTVVVEEYRNGQRIGLVRRDYQLFVVDCPPTTPPDPTITVDNQPITDVQFCEGKTAELKATYNAGWAYQWKQNGKDIPGATNPTLLVAKSGNYQLTTSLTAQCSKIRRSREINVRVTTARFKLKPQGTLTLCGPTGTVNLNALSGTNLTYQWYLDGKLLLSTAAMLTAQQVGRYWAVVRDNNLGCSSTSDTVKVIAAPLPVAVLTPQRATSVICAGDSLPLSVVQRDNYQYQWTLNGVMLTDAINSRLVARRAGQYTLTVTDTTGCMATVPYSLTISAMIKVTLDSLVKQCGLAGASVITLNGSPLGGLYAGLGVTGNQFDPQKAGVGNHLITYTVKSDLVCQQGVAQRTAVITDPSVRIIPARSVTEICAGDSLVLTAQTPTGSYQYFWLMNGQSVSGSSQLIARQTGNYEVKVIDSEGCGAQSQTYPLAIAPTIKVTMDSIPIYCGSDHMPVILHGYPNGGSFSGPGVIGNQYDPRSAGTGTHTLLYTVSSPFDCQNGVASRTAMIRPIPSIKLGADQEIPKGSKIHLHTGLGNGYQYSWTPAGSVDDSIAANPEASPEQTTQYTVQVQDSYGCTATDSVTIFVYERIWIPNAFTPNGDGQHDEWELRGIESYPQAEVTIFNRWGEVVFFSKGYHQPFNGTYSNAPLESGVYAYQIKATSTREAVRGSLLIIR